MAIDAAIVLASAGLTVLLPRRSPARPRALQFRRPGHARSRPASTPRGVH